MRIMYRKLTRILYRFALFIFIVGLLHIFVLSPSCKSPEDPGPEPINYRTNVEITYTRDESKITNPSADGTSVEFACIIHDPELFRHDFGYNPQVFITATNQTGNVFKGTLSKVYRHTKDYAPKHEIRVSDLLIAKFDENGTYIVGSNITGENITIPNAFDLEIVSFSTFGTSLRFKMR